MVARNIGSNEHEIHRLEQLSDDECWSILSHIAFSGKSERTKEGLLDIGRGIAQKCGGLPLAARTLGSLLRFKNTIEEWKEVLSREIWKLDSVKVDLFPHLLLSYNDLLPAQKRCLLYCAVFPKDYVMDVDKLITKWMALGYLTYTRGNHESEPELKGREYIDDLVMRFLLQVVKKDHVTGEVTKCKMSYMLHDFAVYLRQGDSLGKTSCEVCDKPLSVSRIIGPRSLFCDEKQPPLQICDCLRSLRVLSLNGCRLQSVPTELEKLIHLRELDLSENKLCEEDLKSICKIRNLQKLVLFNCQLCEIPIEIGYLIELRHLDLSGNELLKIPDEICELSELRHLDLRGNELLEELPWGLFFCRQLQCLNISHCIGLSELPQEIYDLVNLKGFYNEYTNCLHQYPQGLAKLTALEELNEYFGGRDRSKLGYLKELNRLSRFLCLKIRLANLDDEVVKDAQEAELEKKVHLMKLGIEFVDDHVDDQANEEGKPLCTDVLEALKPHENLQELWISNFKGSKLPSWIASPHYQLREISIDLRYCLSLPPFGMLPCLEEITIKGLYSLEVVGREFLGITASSSTRMVFGFPKLKTLTLYICPKLREWDDITVEDQKSDNVSIMPCLTLLRVISCHRLMALPHRLLSKASSLEELVVTSSTHLRDCYDDKEDPLRKSVSHIPNVTIF